MKTPMVETPEVQLEDEVEDEVEDEAEDEVDNRPDEETSPKAKNITTSTTNVHGLIHVMHPVSNATSATSLDTSNTHPVTINNPDAHTRSNGTTSIVTDSYLKMLLDKNMTVS